MNFLRTLFWVLVTIVVVVFTMHNWQSVTVDLFGGLQADVKLPVLMLFAFLIGFVPLYIYYRAAIWRVRRAVPAPIAPPPVVEPVSPAAPARATDVPPLSDTF